MGISKKGRRKIICNEKQYVWDVSLDFDRPYYCLNIASEDKILILSCPLGVERQLV